MLSDLRKHPRYFLPRGLPAVVEQAKASIVDLSLKGARLQVTQPLAVGAKLPFALMTSGGAISSGATVLWCQIAALALDDEESDLYLAGVVFDDVVPEVGGVLDQLIATDDAIAIVDARSSERYSVMQSLHGCYGDNASDIRVIDLSIRGARLSSRTPFRIGSQASLRFSLVPGPAVDVTGKVAWCRETDRRLGYEIGLEIEGEEALLRAVIAQLCMKKQARVDMSSLRRKFDPIAGKPRSGMLALAS